MSRDESTGLRTFPLLRNRVPGHRPPLCPWRSSPGLRVVDGRRRPWGGAGRAPRKGAFLKGRRDNSSSSRRRFDAKNVAAPGDGRGRRRRRPAPPHEQEDCAAHQGAGCGKAPRNIFPPASSTCTRQTPVLVESCLGRPLPFHRTPCGRRVGPTCRTRWRTHGSLPRRRNCGTKGHPGGRAGGPRDRHTPRQKIKSPIQASSPAPAPCSLRCPAAPSDPWRAPLRRTSAPHGPRGRRGLRPSPALQPRLSLRGGSALAS